MIMVVSSGVHTLVLVPRDGADDLVHGEVYCTVSRRVLFSFFGMTGSLTGSLLRRFRSMEGYDEGYEGALTDVRAGA